MNAADRHLARAARLAVRAHGLAEPNPLVGCVVADRAGDVAGVGWHRRCGGPHAEVMALAEAGASARGGTAWVTLEPCAHHGRTPPCSEALLAAGVARVVYAVPDPHPEASGGGQVLATSGVDVVHHAHVLARRVTAPFVHRVCTGRTWVCAKWAQTIDGRIAAPDGSSQWITSPTSRRLVHRERGRVDVIMTGIGTVLADDPQLTARGVRMRRRAQRLVIDPELAIPATSALVQSARETPLIVATLAPARAGALRDLGVSVWEFEADAGGDVPLADVLVRVSDELDATNVLVEAGAGLLSRLIAGALVNEVAVFTGPRLLGGGMAPLARNVQSMSEATDLAVRGVHRRGDDVLLRAVFEHPECEQG